MHKSFVISSAAIMLLAASSAMAGQDWRINHGRTPVRIGTAGTLGISAQQPPTKPPGAVGAKANVSEQKFNFLDELGGLAGFPCQAIGSINLCGDDRDSDAAAIAAIQGSNSCPVANDTQGKYGDIYSITGSSAYNLECGGAITIANIPVSVTPSPDRIAIPDGNRITIYRRSTSGVYDFIVDETRELPDNLCNEDGSVAMPMPTLNEQMVYFGQTANSIALQAGLNPPAPTYDPSTGTLSGTDISAYGDDSRLVLPISNGRINLPNDLSGVCPKMTDWIKVSAANANSIEFVPSSSDPSCQDVTVELGSGQCLGSLQYMNLESPALVHQPGVNATFLTIQGYPHMLTATADTSYLMMQNGGALRINSGNGQYVLSEGGHMELNGGNILRMSAPATITPSTGRVTLTAGGYIENAAGARIQNYSAGAQVVPSASLPFTVYPERKIILPYGMLLPLSEDATLRTPLGVPD